MSTATGHGTTVAPRPDTKVGRLDSPLAARIRHDGAVYTGVEPDAEWAAEIRRLHKENEYLRRQREILKKAASILAEDPQLGMR